MTQRVVARIANVEEVISIRRTRPDVDLEYQQHRLELQHQASEE